MRLPGLAGRRGGKGEGVQHTPGPGHPHPGNNLPCLAGGRGIEGEGVQHTPKPGNPLPGNNLPGLVGARGGGLMREFTTLLDKATHTQVTTSWVHDTPGPGTHIQVTTSLALQEGEEEE